MSRCGLILAEWQPNAKTVIRLVLPASFKVPAFFPHNAGIPHFSGLF
jgi:hypothetical protein